MQRHALARVVGYVATSLVLLSASAARAADSVAVENARYGTTAWKITNPAQLNEMPGGGSRRDIEGYASLASVPQGGTIQFFVSTAKATNYRIRVYRIGWYSRPGGLDDGPGGRLVHSPPSDLYSAGPQVMPQPDGNGTVECQWPISYQLTVSPATGSFDGGDWVSGVYLAKLSTVPAGRESYILFVVRDDTRPSPYVLNINVNTYQAYNNWGGTSLYEPFTEADCQPNVSHARIVSMNRPDAGDYGAGQFLQFEVHMLRWMEHRGDDVTYVTDVDLDAYPNLLLAHRALLIVGHGEYWSWGMRSAVERARDSGVSLGFFAANSMFWQIRYSPDRRRIYGYKEWAFPKAPCTNTNPDPYSVDSDPVNDRLITTLWRNFPVSRPEERLLGVQDTLYPPPCCARLPLCPTQTCPPPSETCSETNPTLLVGDIHPTDPNHWLFAGVNPGAVLTGLLGYEVDEIRPGSPAGTQSIASSWFPAAEPNDRAVESHLTVYTAPSGAIVFSTGTIFWSLGLDEYRVGSWSPCLETIPVSEAAQRITANFLERVALPPAPPPSVALGGAVSALSAAPGYPATNATDGQGTVWVASTALSSPWVDNNHSWIQLAFSGRKHIDRVRWTGANGVPYPAYSPANYSVLVSDDGVHWEEVISRYNTYGVVNGNEVIDRPAKLVRLATTKVHDGTGWALGLVEFWAEGRSAEPANRLSMSGALASAEFLPSYPVGYAVDNWLNTVWVAGSAANNNAEIRLDLGASKHIDRLKWVCVPGLPSIAHCPADYSIKVSEDGLNWVTAVSRTNPAGVTAGNEPLNHRGRFVKLTTTKVHNGSGWALSFAEIWAEGGNRLIPAVISSNLGDPGDSSDWDVSTDWIADAPSNDVTVAMDFGRPKQLTRLRWHGSGFNTSPSQYRIEASVDGVAWQTVVTRSHTVGQFVPKPSGVVYGEEPLGTVARHLRLVVTKVDDGIGDSLGLIEIWAEGTEAAIVSASSQAPAHPVAHAADGQGTTNWVASNTPSPANNTAWIQVDLGVPRWARRLRWSCRPSLAYPIEEQSLYYPAHCPSAYVVEVSHDQVNWQTLVTYTGSYVLNGNESFYAGHRYVRLRTSSIYDDTGWALSAVEFWTEGY